MMKTKVLAIGAATILGVGVALHVGHEPKCLMKMGIVQKTNEVKPAPVTVESATADHDRTAH
jgi:hypothetical protein